MKKNPSLPVYFFILAVLFSCFLISKPVQARKIGINESHYIAFIQSYERLKPYIEEKQQTSSNTIFVAKPLFMASHNLVVFEQNTAQLRRSNLAEFQRFSTAITDRSGQTGHIGHYFRSVDEWAYIADQVMLSYSAITQPKTAAEYTEFVNKLQPEVFVLFKPEYEGQIEDTIAYLSLLERVPQSQIDLATQYQAELKIIADRMQGNAVGQKLFEALEKNKGQQ
ncbi:MAG: hypothetical protein GC137_05235 [Alphaproteobacteria bacterium]|nr:hypothetical protein [Alphaproteobacteria bacterium]